MQSRKHLGPNLTICRLNQNEIPDCIELVKEVYDEFVGVDYSEKGNKNFYSIIDPQKVAERLADGNLIICCKLRGKIVGMEELRDKNHIALFFVKQRSTLHSMLKRFIKN